MSGLIINEYLCPEHGRFELLVSRDAPDVQPCPAVYPYDDSQSHIDPDCGDEVCERLSPWTPSAVKAHFAPATVQRGTSDERPPNCLDTRPLADGMSMREWTKLNRQKNREIVRDKLKAEGMG